ncbi:hypothetical protein FO442_13790 [Fluviicola chungangensis]|uniref:Uncharacterized protein n=1 Tax=Fluviicola chungangensis TaxID=2597671 RepID=A0A556MPH3_9FLAO|nr:hypothetical protein FO442_13790 [Fluviicola chungangensis]
MNVGRELLNAPFPELVRTLGVGIAEAQYALDRVSIKIAQLMAGFKLNDEGNLERDENSLIKLRENDPGVSLLALGFTPTFYQFVETYIELKLAISMKKEEEVSAESSVGGVAWSPFGVIAASVNASYSQKYQYEASGSSEMRTKLVTVPAPAMFESRLKQLMDEKQIETIQSEMPEEENEI